ncbi:MAG: hypothetical protein ACRCVN_01710 [Spirochaetia bacterium]
MKRKRSLILLSLFSLSLHILGAQSQGTAVLQEARFRQKDAQMGDIYLRYARQAYDEGIYDSVQRLLEQSAEFSSISRDYNVLSGLMAQRTFNVREELMYFVRAYRMPEQNSHYSDQFIEGRIFELYYTMQQYEELMSDYARLASRGMSLTPEKDLYYLLTLSILGLYDELEKLGAKLFQAYSFDVRFYVPLFHQTDFSRVYLPQLRQLSYYINDLQDKGQYTRTLNDLERSIFLGGIKRIQDPMLQKEVVDASFVWLKDDLNYRNFARKIDVYLPEFERQDQLNSLYVDKELLTEEELVEFAKTGTKIIGLDINMDGIPDQKGEFRGTDGYWQYDFNQDGLPEYHIKIQESRITEISEQRGNKVFYWTFTRYPNVQKLEVFEEPRGPALRMRHLIYHVLQGELKIDTSDVVRMSDQWMPIPIFTKKTGLPDLWQVLQKSSQLDEYFNNLHFRKNLIRDGQIYRVWEDSLGRGYFDRLLALENWKVVYGQRDLTNNGQFDVYEYYQDGVWKGLAYFPENQPEPAYYQDWGGDTEIKVWLFDRSQYVGAYSLENRQTFEVSAEAIVQRRMTAQELLHWEDLRMAKIN